MKALAAVGILVVVVIIALFAMSAGTQLRFAGPVASIGQNTPVKVQVENPHGIRRIAAVLEQNGARYTVYEHSQPATRFTFFGKKLPAQNITFFAGKSKAPNLKDGKARLIIEAKGNDFRASTGRLEQDVNVILTPPRVSADGYQHYINQGGMELVTFTVGGNWEDAGVQVGKHTFRSFPMPDRPETERFSMFAYPWDTPEGTEPVVFVRNNAGNEAKAHFWYKVFPKKFRTRDFELTDPMMQRLVDQIEPNSTGDLLTRFLHINGELRRENNKALADLRLKTEPLILWNGPFTRLGKEESMFADVRNYIYQGKKVDQQVHLGYDLSDLQHVPVRAANDGKIVFADNLGIYGNCIVVDHGYGLESIYGHLSTIAVKPGDMVKKGQEMGRSGSTGLALGDHLHFSMQVDGVQTNPKEWWDEHWIQDRILSKIGK